MSASHTEPSEIAGKQPFSKLILHADDSPRMRELVASLFRQQHRVLSVGDCDAALNALKQNHADLVILDHLMPGTDPVDTGFDVCQYIRRHYPGLPVVLYTGAMEGVTVDRVELETKWGAPIVFKGEDLSELQRIVTEMLEVGST